MKIHKVKKMENKENQKLSKGRIFALAVIIIGVIALVFFFSGYSSGELMDFKFLDSLFSDVTENGFKVTKVIDGDTLVVDLHDRETTIRLIGVDTPETSDPDEDKNCAYGQTASQYLKDRLEGEYVDIEYDMDTKDSYGRTLAYIYIGNEMLNETLIKNGYGVYSSFTSDTHRYDSRFIQAQKYAQENKLGMWSDDISDEDTGGLKEKSRI